MDENDCDPNCSCQCAGVPDDDECTHRSDGTDATYCGQPSYRHHIPDGYEYEDFVADQQLDRQLRQRPGRVYP